MKINLWYCIDMNQWRWTLCYGTGSCVKQESGTREDLRLAMSDIANTVEYLLDKHSIT